MKYQNLLTKELNAYNSRDLETFLSCYHPDIEIFDQLTGKIMMSGKEQMAPTYQQMFDASPNLHAKILNTMLMENFYVGHEEVIGINGKETLFAIATYQFQDNLIRRVWFLKKD